MREPIALRPRSPTVERGHYHSAPLHRCKFKQPRITLCWLLALLRLTVKSSLQKNTDLL